MSLDMKLLDRLARETTYGDHSIGWLLFALAHASQARTVLEVGYCKGYSASWLCAGVTASMEPRFDGAIDLPRPERAGTPQVLSIDLAACDGGAVLQAQGYTWHRFLQGDSRSAETMSEVTLWLNGRRLDVLWIDGDHETPGRDLDLYRPLLAEDGLLVCHDAWYEPVRAALRETELSFTDLQGWGTLAVSRRIA